MVVFFLPFSCSASAAVRVIGLELPGLYQQDNLGIYDQLLNETVIEKGLASLEVYPPARANDLFTRCDNCCLSPANKSFEFYEFGSAYVETEPLSVAKIYAFVAPGDNVIDSLEGLKDKVIGIRFGLPYGKSFDSANLTAMKVTNLAQHFKFLERGHIDAFVAYAPDIYLFFQEKGIEPYPHNPSSPLVVHPDSLVCKGIPADFIKDFNESLRELKRTGRYKEILGDRYIPY